MPATERTWPFLGTEALAIGAVTERSLRDHYERIYRNVYIRKDIALTAEKRAVAAWLWSGRRAVGPS